MQFRLPEPKPVNYSDTWWIKSFAIMPVSLHDGWTIWFEPYYAKIGWHYFPGDEPHWYTKADERHRITDITPVEYKLRLEGRQATCLFLLIFFAILFFSVRHHGA